MPLEWLWFTYVLYTSLSSYLLFNSHSYNDNDSLLFFLFIHLCILLVFFLYSSCIYYIHTCSYVWRFSRLVAYTYHYTFYYYCFFFIDLLKVSLSHRQRCIFKGLKSLIPISIRRYFSRGAESLFLSFIIHSNLLRK